MIEGRSEFSELGLVIHFIYDCVDLRAISRQLHQKREKENAPTKQFRYAGGKEREREGERGSEREREGERGREREREALFSLRLSLSLTHRILSLACGPTRLEFSVWGIGCRITHLGFGV